MLTHVEPHRFGVGAVQPLTQRYTPLVSWHNGEAAEHVVEHEPQVATPPRLASQPFAALPSQSAKPGRQVKLQLVPLQLAAALAGTGHAVHEAPHVATLASLPQALPHR